jgi:hypothetical protein
VFSRDSNKVGIMAWFAQYQHLTMDLCIYTNINGVCTRRESHFLVIILIMVLVLGILTAIATPAYQDYLTRTTAAGM